MVQGAYLGTLGRSDYNALVRGAHLGTLGRAVSYVLIGAFRPRDYPSEKWVLGG